MGVVNPVRAWRGRSKPQRSELYLRWSLYLMALAPLPLTVMINLADPDSGSDPASRVALVLGLAQTLVTLRAYRTSLDHYLNRPTDHLRWLALNGGLAVKPAPGRYCCSAPGSTRPTAGSSCPSPPRSPAPCSSPPSARPRSGCARSGRPSPGRSRCSPSSPRCC